MTQTASIWLMILAAFVAANLPFLVERRLLPSFSASRRGKSLAWRLCELLALYLVVGALGLGLEQRAGQIATQSWEFYTITLALFVTLAFPGFVWRYLVQRRNP